MHKLILSSFALLALGTSAAFADGGHTTTVTGSNGNSASSTLQWVCADNVCSWQRVAVGPQGATAVHNGSAAVSAEPGTVTYDVNRQGPYHSVQRHGTVTRN